MRWDRRPASARYSVSSSAVVDLPLSSIAGFGQRGVVFIALAAVLLDMAVQTSLIMGQHTVYRIDPAARGRLSSSFIAIFFFVGAIGSQIGALAYHAAGWGAVSVFGVLLSVAAGLYWLTERRLADELFTKIE